MNVSILTASLGQAMPQIFCGDSERKAFWCFRIILFFVLSSATYVRADSNATFSGSWHDKGTKNSSFLLDLVQNGSRIEGYHIAVALHGHRLDAVLRGEDKPSITGAVSGNTATVKFESGYSDAIGTATIALRGNKIVWTVTSSSSPAYYLPLHDVLYLQKRK